jgi:hypothetical protein
VFRKLGVSNRTQAALAAIAMDAGTPPGLASTGTNDARGVAPRAPDTSGP